MRNLHVNWLVMALSLGFGACAVDVPPLEAEAVGVTDNALTLSEDGCPLPRPAVRGCRIACKPCLIPECVDGKWTYERYDWDGCDPRPLPGGGGCCKASFSGGCPAECSCCDYN